ncbi:hypothetical protein ABZU76_05070 [Amycolatopsis sp. NPDC005232]|uniref:hypothetical protein n=1 Tax=Amycolatopsis sp. NPDC005232 TaxID=3157027 RepID=UPI0033B8B7CC
MPDGNTGGLQGVNNELTTPAQQAPADSGLIPGSNTAPPPAQPPDYLALGSDQAKSDFATASANGGWDFDPEAIDKVITQLEDSLDGDYAEARRHAAKLMQIPAPGSEVGSQGYVQTASASGASYNQFLKGATDFISAYVKTLKDIRTAYQNNDEQTKEQLRNFGKAL